MFIAGEVYDFEEEKEVEGILKILMYIQRIKKLSHSKNNKH